MTVQDLIDQLSMMDPDAQVRLAMQPSWPFEYSIGDIVETDSGVYIAEANQVGYLSGDVREELGW